LEELGFTVNAMYYEGGMCYAGEFSDGCDQEINLEGMSADDIERDYPELDEALASVKASGNTRLRTKKSSLRGSRMASKRTRS